MERYDFTTQRLFVERDLGAGGSVEANRQQANYLLSVLRMRGGDRLLVFNGRDGEWLARIRPVGRRNCTLEIDRRTRPQPQPGLLQYCFAPLKRARLDYMVQKAVEMGAAILQPVLTERVQASRINLNRMQANILEAAEQCGILAIPQLREPVRLDALVEKWDRETALIFCDEAGGDIDTRTALETLRRRPLAVLVGPEGGFSPNERRQLLAREFVVPISLGPRILRADTAAVAAMAVVQLLAGDWTRDDASHVAQD